MAWVPKSEQVWTSCIAILDHRQKTYYLIDATPDIKHQIQRLESEFPYKLSGIFLTHAHMGHYTGLMHLGREAESAKKIPVFAMPKMSSFLQNNGPWSQLVDLGNIELQQLEQGSEVRLNDFLTIKPHLVPHRDEFSETVGYEITGPEKTAWFIPDIDKWQRWQKPLEELLVADWLLIDGTFYENGEIPGRDMSMIPHPFMTETMNRLEGQSMSDKSKIYFIHLNHTNPALWDPSTQQEVQTKGFNICRIGQTFNL